MRRALIFTVFAMAACSDPAHAPDAAVDAPIDTPAGSASRGWASNIEASPKDYNLELGVLAVSLVVAAGPLRARQRRT